MLECPTPHYVAKVVDIETPFSLTPSPCPTTSRTTKEWTEKEREVAEDAQVAKNIENLKDLVRISETLEPNLDPVCNRWPIFLRTVI